jgi:hypothetical protein
MANVPITSLPVATSLGPTTDYLEVSKYVGAPGANYLSVRATPQLIANAFLNNVNSGVEYVISNLGSVLVTGVQPYFTMPYQGVITSAALVVSPSGSLSIDIWRTSYAQFDGGVTHPVASDSICGGNYLSITSGTKATSNLNSWTLSFGQGDILAINIQSVSSVTSANLSLYVSRSFP